MASEKEIIEVELRLKSLDDKVERLEKSIEDLVEAWKAANGIVSFVKWVAGLVTAIGVIYAALKGVN